MESFEGNHYSNKIKIVDFIGYVLEDIYLYAYSIACSSGQLTRRFFEHIQLAGFLDIVSEKLENHPLLKFASFLAAGCFAVPAVVFIAFAIVSFIITFTGFLLIEGVILAVGGFCLCACLVSMIMVISVLAMAMGTFYFMAVKLQLI